MNLLLQLRLDQDKSKIKKLIEKKAKKFSKYLSNTSKLSWYYFFDNGRYYCDVKVSGFNGPTIYARANSESKFKVIDQVTNRIDKQLNKKFGQTKHRIHKLNVSQLS